MILHISFCMNVVEAIGVHYLNAHKTFCYNNVAITKILKEFTYILIEIIFVAKHVKNTENIFFINILCQVQI